MTRLPFDQAFGAASCIGSDADRRRDRSKLTRRGHAKVIDGRANRTMVSAASSSAQACRLNQSASLLGGAVGLRVVSAGDGPCFP